MYCPQCGAEYREGFTECADCRVALRAGVPPEPAQDRGLQLVTILETTDSFALSLAKASLEEAGIQYVVSGDEPRYIAGFPGAFGVGETPLCKCRCVIQVTPEDEREARTLMEPLKQPNPIEGENRPPRRKP